MAQWTFLTNHAHVLLCVADNPNARLRDVAEQVGITDGRRNIYRLNTAMPLRHPLDRDHRIGELLATFANSPTPADSPSI
jgi:hypothetical protein